MCPDFIPLVTGVTKKPVLRNMPRTLGTGYFRGCESVLWLETFLSGWQVPWVGTRLLITEIVLYTTHSMIPVL